MSDAEPGRPAGSSQEEVRREEFTDRVFHVRILCTAIGQQTGHSDRESDGFCPYPWKRCAALPASTGAPRTKLTAPSCSRWRVRCGIAVPTAPGSTWTGPSG